MARKNRSPEEIERRAKIRVPHRRQPVQNAMLGYDGHYEKVDWQAA